MTEQQPPMTDADFATRYGPAALVTGASSGIGRAFAVELAARGLDLLLVARRADRLRTLAAELEQAHGVAVRVCAADLAEPAAVEQIMAAATGLEIGLLVSNAGFGLKGAHQDIDPARMAAMLQVNCAAPLQLSHRLMPGLLRRGQGGIIITSSVEGLMGIPYSAAYAASKAFTNSLGESLWGELSSAGVDVLALCPGSTDTEAHALQGIDSSTLEGMMSPRDVVLEALANLRNGPVYVAGEQNRAMFDALTGMPRREALLQMADNIRAAQK
ncbi:SDR family NAD(P)-dependent oxidoreductase [Haliea sp. E1-2-M8]|uniref:SDR family NAD(P)-dependent oxidoreductase n=1 Tax=Haliea sp. E1-2-M8 TaxID=3064706 RepID=UPI002723543E|nr:SDR family NAD(P)-dependent oxidoreductase [Haliea sp. E1-2-M8]MDO8863443.1 SDR family NAD(P)-dependent oxidoreductase [Haliea sp. E1-2-M8]